MSNGLESRADHLLLWAMLALAVLLGGAGRALADPSWTAAPVTGGMTIHRDPATGRLTGPPAGAVAVPRAALPVPMRERVGITPAGGVLLDGIPRMGVTVTAGPGGSVVSHCERQPEAR